MQEQHIDALVEAYALGALEAAEVYDAEQHLATCAWCRALVRDAHAAAEQLLFAAPQVAPPSALRERVMRRIAAEKATAGHTDVVADDKHDANGYDRLDLTHPTSPPNPFARFIRGMLSGLSDDTDGTRLVGDVLRGLLAEPDCFIALMAAPEGVTHASARLVGSRSRREAVVVATGLQPIASDQAYQVWFLRGGQPEPNALFTVDHRGEGFSVLRAHQPLATFDLVAVTPEPHTGSLAPTGPIVLAGALTA